MWYGIALTTVGGLIALYTSRREGRVPYALAKALAAVGFVWVALAAGLPASTASRLLVVGLLLSGIGDIALAFTGRTAFLAGMGAFALTHVAYATAFAMRGVSLPWLAVVGVIVSAASLSVWRWLRPHLPQGMVRPLRAYIFLCSAMMALAWSSFAAGSYLTAALGATAFYVSDLAVARERFVTHSANDKLWGLPLYYLGQTLIALSAR